MNVCPEDGHFGTMEVRNATLARKPGGRFGLVLVVAALTVFALVAVGEVLNRLNDPVSA